MTNDINNKVCEVPDKSALSLKTGFYIIVSLVFICFIPDLNHELLDWDDRGYVVLNENIRELSFDTVVWSFTTFYTNYWAPLTWLSLAVDYALFGLNPLGYHLTNNIIHSLNSGLFFLFSYCILNILSSAGKIGNKTRNPPETWSGARLVYCSMLAALFFGIHPLRVESVAWVTERKDVLCMFFGLFSLLAYLRHSSIDHKKSFVTSRYYWGMLVCFTLSLLCKAMFVTLPVMFLVLDWFPLGRYTNKNIRELLLEKLPMLVLGGAVSILTMRATAYTRDTYTGIDVSSQITVAVKSLATYLRLFLWPVDINTIYLNPGNVVLDAAAVISITVMCAITIVCVTQIRRYPFFMAVWLLFLIPLAPVLNVSGIHAMAPRFTYLPDLSLSLAAAVGIFSALAACANSQRLVLAVKSATVLLLIWFACITIRDIGFWKNDITLWTRVIDLTPHTFGKAYFQRSLFLNQAGEYQKALSDVNEALVIAQRKQYANLYEIYGHRATIQSNMKEYDGALADLTMAIEISNEMFRSNYLTERGKLYQILGKSSLAAQDFASAKNLPQIKMNLYQLK